MSEGSRRRPPRVWLWLCTFTPLALFAQLIACMPAAVARRLIRSYSGTIGALPWVGLEIRQVCKVLDFHLLSKVRPGEALAVLEAKLTDHPEALLVSADYAIAGQLSERLGFPEKALTYYQRAGLMAPPGSVEFRVGMAQRIQRLGGQPSW
jgi:hypothetical protein